MLSFYVFLAVMIAILGISSYSYQEIDTSTGESEVSQKINLSTLIIAGTVIFFSCLLKFINYINYERGSNILSFGTLVTSVLMMLSYGYLNKERKSSSQYDEYKKQLDSVENNTNSRERDLTMIIGIVGLGVVAAYLFIIIGKVFYSTVKTNTITVREPMVIQSEDEKPTKINYEDLRKKFIL